MPEIEIKKVRDTGIFLVSYCCQCQESPAGMKRRGKSNFDKQIQLQLERAVTILHARSFPSSLLFSFCQKRFLPPLATTTSLENDFAKKTAAKEAKVVEAEEKYTHWQKRGKRKEGRKGKQQDGLSLSSSWKGLRLGEIFAAVAS